MSCANVGRDRPFVRPRMESSPRAIRADAAKRRSAEPMVDLGAVRCGRYRSGIDERDPGMVGVGCRYISAHTDKIS